MSFWSSLETVFFFLLLGDEIQLAIRKNKYGDDPVDSAWVIFDLVNAFVIAIFICVKYLVTYRRIQSSPVFQTRARLKVIECVQAYTFTLSFLLAFFVIGK